jgi:tetratricopeptide (TPR) repeat protein
LEVSADARITLALLEMHNNNAQKSIIILEQVIVMAEENGLQNTAQRAHNNLGVTLSVLLNPTGSLKHSIQAVLIGQQIRNNYINSLSNLVEENIQLGNLDEPEMIIVEKIPQVDAAPKSEIERVTLLCNARIHYARGEWQEALDNQRRCIAKIRQGENNYLIANRNIELAIISLELNHLRGQGNLSEAETALRCNLDLNYRLHETCCLLCILSAQQASFEQAQNLSLLMLKATGKKRLRRRNPTWSF